MKKILAYSAIFLLLFVSHLHAQTFVQEGIWRGVFKGNDGTEIPINFEIKGKKAEQATVYLINGEERFEVKRLQQTGDSLFVYFDDFDNELALKIQPKLMTGVLRKQKTGLHVAAPAGSMAAPLLVPFTAIYGETFRFADKGTKAIADLSGKWDITFTDKEGVETKAVGVFKQTNNKLTGTFMRTTGDSRFLDGVVQGNSFFLSSFIGAGPNITSGTIGAEKNTLSGTSGGATSQTKFTGIRNEKAALPDLFSLTTVTSGVLEFSLPDANGNIVSLKDPKFRNKVVIVSVSGTWCPNCIDEANFLAPWYKKNKDRGVEVVSVFYERKTDPAYVKTLLNRFKEKHGVEYDQLFGGVSDKKSVSSSLHGVNNFHAFPTTFFVNKNGKVVKVHTGYTGPATGKYYEEFVKEFNAEIDLLLAEPAVQAKGQ